MLLDRFVAHMQLISPQTLRMQLLQATLLGEQLTLIGWQVAHYEMICSGFCGHRMGHLHGFDVAILERATMR